MAQNRGRVAGQKQAQDRRQSQARAIEHKRVMGEAYDRLDAGAAAPRAPGVGVPPRDEDLGPDDARDGDEWIEAEEGDEGGRPAEEDGPEEEDSPVTLGRVIGSRSPTVLFRLEAVEDGVRARLLVVPADDVADAVAELCTFTEEVFRLGRRRFHDAGQAERWERLLGAKPAGLAERLRLLAQVAIGAGAKVALAAQEAKKGPTLQATDRGLGRFAGKFALLPDGLPFSLRLLLTDRRGRPGRRSSFKDLPDALRLCALQTALREEEQDGTASTDDGFRDRLQKALADMNIDVAKPSYDEVRNLRRDLERRGRSHVFGSMYERQRRYAGRPAPQVEEAP